MKPEVKRPVPNEIIIDAEQDIGKRYEQEDYYIYSDWYNCETGENGIIAVLTDGMGGYANGKQAAETGAKAFIKSYTKSPEFGINKRLIDAVNYANKAVCAQGEGGAALVCAVISGWRLYWLGVGDCRIYLYRNGILRKLNIEHNYRRRLVGMACMGEISMSEALTDIKGDALTSYLGIENITEYDFNDCEFPLLRNDKILLCSDGLYRTLSNREIGEAIAGKCYMAAYELRKKVLNKRKPHQDNMTAVVLNIE